MSVTLDNDYGNYNEGSGGSSFLLGMLCGAAVGATLGLLLAPKPRADLRRDLAKSAGDLKRKATDVYGNAVNAMGDLKDRGTDAMNQGREAVDKFKSRARQTSSRMESTQ
jgi:gas vesicle protein